MWLGWTDERPLSAGGWGARRNKTAPCMPHHGIRLVPGSLALHLYLPP